MNSRYKFRQPIFLNGKFHSWHYWGFLSSQEFVSPSNSWVDGKPSQQFTGLLDKFGREIYDGDIVKFDWHVDEIVEHHIGLIRFSKYKYEVCWSFFYRSLDINNGEIWWVEHYPGVKSSQHIIKNIEVIGNIYESPEPLTNPTE